jgi:hypothetical protein
MRSFASVVCALSVLLATPYALADIAAIHADALPQESGILHALKDATELEPYTHLWTQNWKYPVAKQDAAAHLGLDLASLSSAVKTHPNNTELLLLTGLVARYAYNVDVPGSYEKSIAALTQAEKLDPVDIRAPWFHATLECQTTEPKAGAEGLLAIESSHPWESLPAAFWADYMECASVTNMPAHVLRAEGHLEKLHAPHSDERDFLTSVTQKRFDAFDPEKDYAPKEVWQGDSVGNDLALTSTSCGVRMHVHGDWTIDRLSLSKGSCIADFGTGPYKQTASKMRPSILVMVQQPQKGETLEEYSKRFQTKGTFGPFLPSRCPTGQCIALKGTRIGAYGKDGDGLGFMLIFERYQPAFPGLIFESPSQPPHENGSTGISYYRPGQTLARIPGKLYYVVLLDTAASIEDPAMKDFDFFLQELTVE